MSDDEAFEDNDCYNHDDEDYDENCGVIGRKEDMQQMFQHGTYFTAENDSDDEDTTSSGEEAPSEDEEWAAQPRGRQERQEAADKWNAAHKKDMEAKHLRLNALRDKASARKGEEVSVFSARLRDEHHAKHGKHFPFLDGTITGFTFDAFDSTTRYQVKLKRLQHHDNPCAPAKIAESDTQDSVPEDELVNKAEHFDIPAYDSDPGSGEEEIYELDMEKAEKVFGMDRQRLAATSKAIWAIKDREDGKFDSWRKKRWQYLQKAARAHAAPDTAPPQAHIATDTTPPLSDITPPPPADLATTDTAPPQADIATDATPPLSDITPPPPADLAATPRRRPPPRLRKQTPPPTPSPPPSPTPPCRTPPLSGLTPPPPADLAAIPRRRPPPRLCKQTPPPTPSPPPTPLQAGAVAATPTSTLADTTPPPPTPTAVADTLPPSSPTPPCRSPAPPPDASATPKHAAQEEASAECSPASVLFLPNSPIAAAVEKLSSPPHPQAFKLPKDASPPDRGGSHLDFNSEDIENTNDARDDHGCGHSGAQATAHKAVLKPKNIEEWRKRIPLPILSVHLPVFLPLSSARPLLPMPHVPTPPAQTVTQSNSQQNA